MHLKLLYCFLVTFFVKVLCFADEECLKAADFTTVEDWTEVIGEWHTNPPNCSVPSDKIRVITPEDKTVIKRKCGEKFQEFDFKLAYVSTWKDSEEYVAGFIGTKGNNTYYSPGCNYIMIMEFRKMGDYYVVMKRQISGVLAPVSMKMPRGRKQQCVITTEGLFDFC